MTEAGPGDRGVAPVFCCLRGGGGEIRARGGAGLYGLHGEHHQSEPGVRGSSVDGV